MTVRRRLPSATTSNSWPRPISGSTHPQAWAAQWARIGLPLGVMVHAADDDTQTPTPITPQIVSNEQGLVNAFSAAGLIPNKFDFSQYSDSGFNSVLSTGA